MEKLVYLTVNKLKKGNLMCKIIFRENIMTTNYKGMKNRCI